MSTAIEADEQNCEGTNVNGNDNASLNAKDVSLDAVAKHNTDDEEAEADESQNESDHEPETEEGQDHDQGQELSQEAERMNKPPRECERDEQNNNDTKKHQRRQEELMAEQLLRCMSLGTDMPPLQSGRVKWYDAEKGIGIIIPIETDGMPSSVSSPSDNSKPQLQKEVIVLSSQLVWDVSVSKPSQFLVKDAIVEYVLHENATGRFMAMRVTAPYGRPLQKFDANITNKPQKRVASAKPQDDSLIRKRKASALIGTDTHEPKSSKSSSKDVKNNHGNHATSASNDNGVYMHRSDLQYRGYRKIEPGDHLQLSVCATPTGKLVAVDIQVQPDSLSLLRSSPPSNTSSTEIDSSSLEATPGIAASVLVRDDTNSVSTESSPRASLSESSSFTTSDLYSEKSENKVSGGTIFRCELCNKDIKTIQQLEAHQGGRKHQHLAKMQAQGAIFHCEPCEKTFSSASEQHAHMQTSEHIDKLAMLSAADVAASIKRANVPTLWCTLCDLKFTGVVQLQQHIEGRKHIQAEQLHNSGGSVNAVHSSSITPTSERQNDPNVSSTAEKVFLEGCDPTSSAFTRKRKYDRNSPLVERPHQQQVISLITSNVSNAIRTRCSPRASPTPRRSSSSMSSGNSVTSEASNTSTESGKTTRSGRTIRTLSSIESITTNENKYTLSSNSSGYKIRAISNPVVLKPNVISSYGNGAVSNHPNHSYSGYMPPQFYPQQFQYPPVQPSPPYYPHPHSLPQTYYPPLPFPNDYASMNPVPTGYLPHPSGIPGPPGENPHRGSNNFIYFSYNQNL